MITYENTRTIRTLLENSVKKHGAHTSPFIRYEKEDIIYDVGYEQFAEMCRKVGAYVNEKRRTLGRRVHVGLFGSSGANYLAVLLGAMGSGNVAVPMDEQMDLAHLTDCVDRSDVDILFYDWEHEPLIRDARKDCAKVTEYFSLQNTGKAPCLDDLLADERLNGRDWGFGEEPEPDDLAMILFTSGTTGKSKGVMLTNFNLVGNALSQNTIDDEFEAVVALNVLPIHHVFCITADVLSTLYKCGTVCINGPISEIVKHLRMFEPTILCSVPMLVKVLYNRIRSIVTASAGLREKDAMRMLYGNRLSCIVCGGGGLPENLAKKYQAMGLRIGQGYGMSECSPTITEPNYDRPDKVASAGRALAHVEIRIAEGGEVQTRSPFVMQGYYGEPELTKETFTEDGWLKTGDVGYIDDEGYLYLTGRMKNLIVLSNGENVAPEEIEAEFSTEPLIKDILVFGEDDMIKCEVYPDFQYAETAGIHFVKDEVEDIVRRHNNNLPRFKRIMQTSIRQRPFVKTTSNKIIRGAFMKERTAASAGPAEGARLPENEAQEKIYAACSDVLGHKKFGIDTDLYTTGLDSLGSVMLITALQDSLGFSLTLAELMEKPTVEKLAELWQSKSQESGPDYSVREKYPITTTQMTYVYKIRGNTTANIPVFCKLGGRIDANRLEKAIHALFEIHPILKDRIEPDEDGTMYNFRDDSRPADIERLTLSAAEWAEKQRSLLRPYLYTKGENLYHIGIYSVEGSLYLFFDIAHAIGDGETLRILVSDLNDLYMERPVKKSGYTFYEYILDEQAELEAGSREADDRFYREALDGCELTRSILAKKDSYDLGTAHNAVLRGVLRDISPKELKFLCDKYGVTENALFLTAFSYTVGLFGASHDTAITSTHNGRTDGRWFRLAGPLFIRYVVRNKEVPNESVEDMLKRNAAQIIRTMKSRMFMQPMDEMLIQYQGDLLNIPEIGGQLIEPIKIQQDALPFHLMIYAGSNDYTYELRYWENRFDREMLRIFMLALENILAAMQEETSARRLKEHLPARLYPRHMSVSAEDLNAALGCVVIPDPEPGLMVKPYVLDEYGSKKPYGAWGELYILNHKVNGSGDTMRSLYTPGTLYHTGIEARITPDGKIEALYQAGRTVKLETETGRRFVNLFELERALANYPGVERADCSIVYGANSVFRIKAALAASGELDASAIQEYVAEQLGRYMVPEAIVVNGKPLDA